MAAEPWKLPGAIGRNRHGAEDTPAWASVNVRKGGDGQGAIGRWRRVRRLSTRRRWLSVSRQAIDPMRGLRARWSTRVRLIARFSGEPLRRLAGGHRWFCDIRGHPDDPRHLAHLILDPVALVEFNVHSRQHLLDWPSRLLLLLRERRRRRRRR